MGFLRHQMHSDGSILKDLEEAGESALWSFVEVGLLGSVHQDHGFAVSFTGMS